MKSLFSKLWAYKDRGITLMTLYELIKNISSIITPETDDFYEYVIHTSDENGGFLRTRYCWWDKCVEDHKICSDFKKVLVTSKTEIDVNNFRNIKDGEDTVVKMQISYDEPNASIEDADWDSQLGYNYIYIFDLVNNTYIKDFIKCPYA